MTDTLPAGLTASSISGEGWACTSPPATEIACTRSDSLGPYVGYAPTYPAISLMVDVAGNATGPATNSATVSGGGETNTANNTASDGPSQILTPGAGPNLI